MIDDDLDAEDLEEIERELAEEDAAAVLVLRAALDGQTGGPPPEAELATAERRLRAGLVAGEPDYDFFANATGWNGDLPEDPEDLWIEALLSVVAAEEETGLPEELQAEIDALQHAHWVGAVIELVRAGPGADASPAALAGYVARCPEVEGEWDEDDESFVRAAFEQVLQLWEALGVVDSERRLTALGAWALPLSLELAWSLSGSLSGGLEPDAAAVEEFRSELLAALTPDAGAGLDQETLVRLARLAGEERIVPIARTEVHDDPAWDPFLRRLLAATEGTPVAAGPAYLLAARGEWAGDLPEQERWLDAALAADPDFVEALFDAAELAGDRGDARTAKTLLERAGTEYDDPDLAIYRAALAPSASSTPRNAPCPCGSGRKFKLCHGAQAGQPLSDRAIWLFSKLIGFVTRPAHREALHPWVLARTPEDRTVEEIADAYHDLLMYDAAIFDGELLDRFLAVRGPLLPADERELAEAWRSSSRSVYEVDAVRPGVGVTLRDLVTGEAVDLLERGASREFAAGAVLIARLLDSGAGRMFGFAMPVPPHRRDDVVTAVREVAEPAAFLAWVTSTELADTEL